MNNVIVGTAGHVDHGKTCLIRALTGVDADRLKEEKQRGITIELGFADMQAPDGTDIGIIDVPGHEKFIHNMLAGIGGIDMVLLVVAADEGVMPQTVEHLDIMRLLSIKKGIIVITKSDMVEPEWLEMVEADIREAVAGTFLENAPAIAVSSATGENIETLRSMIFEMVKDAGNRNNNPAILRIPIDRVFTISGFGVVVTGTLTEGTIRVGQEVTVYPQGLTTKVRNLQVHGQMVESAFAGQRTAVNLQNVKKEDIPRGAVLAASGSMKSSMMADIKLNVLPDSKRTILNGSRVHCHYGSAEALCKVVLLDREAVGPGEACFAQLRFEEEVAMKQGDACVLRYYSPLETIAGGVVLNANPVKHKREDAKVLEALKIRESGDDAGVLGQALYDESKNFATVETLAKQLGQTKEETLEKLGELAATGKAIGLTEDIYIHQRYAAEILETANKLLADFHAANPLMEGMLKEEFRNKLGNAAKNKNAKGLERIIRYLGETAELKLDVNSVAAKDFEVQYTKAQAKLRDELRSLYKSCGCEAPDLNDVLADYKNKTDVRQMVVALEADGSLTRLSGNTYLDRETLNGIIEKIKSKIESDGSISLAELRDMLGTSRKYAMMILDYCDLIKLTKMDGEVRKFY